MVTIQAGGVLSQSIPPQTQVDARTVGEAVAQFDLPDTSELILLVNGRLAHWQTELEDGDTLKLLPSVGGG